LRSGSLEINQVEPDAGGQTVAGST